MSDTNARESGVQQGTPDFIRYFKICSAISIAVWFYGVFFSDERYGFWGYLVILVFYAVIPAICVTIGDFLRKAAMPSLILTNGGMTGLLKAKAFWSVGPQIIGWIVGIFIAAQLLESWFDIAVR